MGKIAAQILKNLKLFGRSKLGIWLLLIAPIILLVITGLVFDKPVNTIEIGVSAMQFDQKVNNTIILLNATAIKVLYYDSIENCSIDVLDSKIAGCLSFGGVNLSPDHISFFVDKSNVNTVDYILKEVNMRLSPDAKTPELASHINVQVNDLKSMVSGTMQYINSIKQQESNLLNEINSITSSLDTISVSVDTPQPIVQETGQQTDEQVKAQVEQSFTQLNKTLMALNIRSTNAIKKAMDLMELTLQEVEGSALSEDEKESIRNKMRADLLDIYLRDIDILYTKTVNDSSQLQEFVEEIDNSMAQVEQDIQYSLNAKEVLMPKISSQQNLVGQQQQNLDSLQNSLQAILTKLEQFSVPDPQRQLDGPSDIKGIGYEEETVRVEQESTPEGNMEGNDSEKQEVKEETKSGRMKYMYPSVLVLILLLVSLSFGTVMMIAERTSKAAIRNFLSPISDFAFLFAKLLSAMIIIFIQIVFVILISDIFLGINFMSGLLANILVLTASSMLFCTIGIILAMFISSVEMGMITSVITSTLLFILSDLIFPLQMLSPTIKNVLLYNPFMIAKSLLKRAMLLDQGFGDILWSLGGIVLTSVVLLIVASWLYKVIKNKSIRYSIGAFIVKRLQRRR